MSDYDSAPATYEHIQLVQSYLTSAAVNLLDRGLLHDQSKLREPEKAGWDEHTPKLALLEYGTDEYRAALRALNPTVTLHYKANPHHPEHHALGIDGMSLLDLVEMLCDWRAATTRMKAGAKKTLAESIEINQERFGYGDQLKSILLATVKEMGG